MHLVLASIISPGVQVQRLMEDYQYGRDYIAAEHITDGGVTRDHVRRWKVLQELQVMSNGSSACKWHNMRQHARKQTGLDLILPGAGQERDTFLQNTARQLPRDGTHSVHAHSWLGLRGVTAQLLF